MTQEVLRQCKDFLAGVDIESDDQERRRKTVELGEKVLAEERTGEEYNGLWKDWYKNCFLGAVSHWGHGLIRYKYSHQFDLQDGKWIIRSIRLREDCSVKVGFWGDGAAKQTKIVHPRQSSGVLTANKATSFCHRTSRAKKSPNPSGKIR